MRPTPATLSSPSSTRGSIGPNDVNAVGTSTPLPSSSRRTLVTDRGCPPQARRSRSHSQAGPPAPSTPPTALRRTATASATSSSTATLPARLPSMLHPNVQVGGLSVLRETDGVGDNSGNATKRFVDANIEINPPEETNTVGDPHTFTVTLYQDDGIPMRGAGGDGVTGFTPATVGNVDVTLSNDATSNFTINLAASTCDDNQPSGDNLDDSGQCTIVFTSNTAGTVTGNATGTFTVGGVILTRSTNGQAPNSGRPSSTLLLARLPGRRSTTRASSRVGRRSRSARPTTTRCLRVCLSTLRIYASPCRQRRARCRRRQRQVPARRSFAWAVRRPRNDRPAWFRRGSRHR